MKKVLVVTAALTLLALSIVASADVFNLSEGFTNLETVAVGDPGNAGELSGDGVGFYPNRICGSVVYSYNIGKYEVTAKQYTDFLNEVAKTDTYGLYNTNMDTANDLRGCNIKRTGTSDNYSYSVANDYANRPVNYVSYWDSCRFANWLGNGQGSGSTETGAYTLNGYTGTDGRTIGRNLEAKWAVTSEDEWYKAAYYMGGGTNSGYWDYPTQSNSIPSNDITNPDGGNNANFYQSGDTIASPYYRTDVGEFENSESAYGTFDQGGNVWEWNEAVVYQGSDYAYRGQRGGSFSLISSYLQALHRDGYYPTFEDSRVGFRVSEVPEPSSIIALLGGFAGLLGIRRRRA